MNRCAVSAACLASRELVEGADHECAAPELALLEEATARHLVRG